MPFLTFPEPTGPYAVGQCDSLWSDGNKRKLIVRIFYPVLKESAEGVSARAPWLPETYGAKCISYAEAYATFMWRPGITAGAIGKLAFLPLLHNVQTRTLADAPLADLPGRLKPLIYSHGVGGTRSCYSAVCVDLASHGYFVVAPEHSDGSASLNVLPDKSVVEHRFVPPKAIIVPREKRIPGGFTRSLVPHHQPKPKTQYEFRNGQLKQRVEEVITVADCLEELLHGIEDNVQLPPALTGKLKDNLDMAKLSCVGHSFGAATCVSACAADERFKACVAHDAWLFPLDEAVAEGALSAPTLFLNADTFDMLWPEEGSKTLCNLLVRTRDQGKQAEAFAVNGTKHQNFADFTLLAPQLTMSMGVAGSTDPEVAFETIHKCDASFLEHALEGREGKWQPAEELNTHLTQFEVERWGGSNGLHGGGSVKHVPNALHNAKIQAAMAARTAMLGARDRYREPGIMDV